MGSLLCLIGPDGKVQTTFWNTVIPAMDLDSWRDYFEPDQQSLIQDMLAMALRSTGAIHCESLLTIRGTNQQLQSCWLAQQDHALVLGQTVPTVPNNQNQESLSPDGQDIPHRFMGVLLTLVLQNIRFDGQVPRSSYEQIQMLNNELINTHRSLQKANAQLYRLNAELSSRLVQDALTGLVSRYQYRTEIEQLISRSPDRCGFFAFIDIDNFKQINDTYGHPIGDLYLIAFANRLRTLQLSDSSILMRISGDEFGVYVHGFPTVDQAILDSFWMQFQAKVLKDPLQIEALCLSVGCSLGLSIYGQDTDDIYSLIEYADFAMYQAKSNGKRQFRIFDQEAYDRDREAKASRKI